MKTWTEDGSRTVTASRVLGLMRQDTASLPEVWAGAATRKHRQSRARCQEGADLKRRRGHE